MLIPQTLSKWSRWYRAAMLCGSLAMTSGLSLHVVSAQEGPSFAAESNDTLEATPASAPLRTSDGHTLTADEIRFIVSEHMAAEDKKKEDAKKKEYVVGSDTKMTASWNNGMTLESANKDFKAHVGGRVQFDGVFLDGSEGHKAINPFATEDAVNFRRARLRVDGTMYENYEFAAEFDFVNSVNANNGDVNVPAVGGLENQGNYNSIIGVVAPTDLWFAVTRVPYFGNFRIGNVKEPIGLEHLASSRYLDFMERAFNQDAYYGQFNNGFTPGILSYNWAENERMTWQWGLFKTTQNVFASEAYDGGYAVTSRATFLPYYDEPSNGRYLFHLGAATSFRDGSQIAAGEAGQFRTRTRASLRNGLSQNWPTIADTGVFFADNQAMLNFELAFQNGPLKIQSEYMASIHNDAYTNGGSFGPPGTSPFAYPTRGNSIGAYFSQGYYVEALYFLTGEHLAYDRQGGTFGRVGVAPFENAFAVSNPRGSNFFGSGAWQVGLRYNVLDLQDNGLHGGVVQDMTAGLNWFLNPRSKIQWNYVYARRDAPVTGANSNMTGIGMRLAWDF